MRACVVGQGEVACFERGLTDADGQAVNSEVSAVVWTGSRLVMASDKNVPGENRSPVFAFACDDDGHPLAKTREHLTHELIRTGEKYEDFAISADGGTVIATTGFDRVDHGAAESHRYNRLLAWPIQQPERAALIGERVIDGVASSVDLRHDLAAALDAPYFKIEGLAAVPGQRGGADQLLLGIREVGRDHADFDYVCRIVGVDYAIEDNTLRLTSPLRVVYEFEPSAWSSVRYTVGLSSLEYDCFNERLLILTSFEVDDDRGESQIGAYLWSLSLAALAGGRPPTLVANETGDALEFAGKAEGVAVLDRARLFVVYDNDRELGLGAHRGRESREPHEAPYTLMTIDG